MMISVSMRSKRLSGQPRGVAPTFTHPASPITRHESSITYYELPITQQTTTRAGTISVISQTAPKVSPV